MNRLTPTEYEMTSTQAVASDDGLNATELKGLLANLSIGICRFVIHPPGWIEFLYLNPIAQEWLEIQPSQTPPKLSEEGVTVGDRPSFQGSLATAFETKTPWRWQGYLALPSGVHRWVEAIAQPSLQADGRWLWDGTWQTPPSDSQPNSHARSEAGSHKADSHEAGGREAGGREAGINSDSVFSRSTAVLDATTTKKATAAPKSTEPLSSVSSSRFISGLEAITPRGLADHLFHNFPGMAYRCRNSASWSMEFVSPGCVALTGYQPEQFLPNGNLSYADLIHPHDQAMVWDMVQAAIALQQPFQMIYRIQTADGQEKWVWEQGVGVLGATGALEALEGFILDITPQKQLETMQQRSAADLKAAQFFLESVLSHLPIAVIAKDATTLEFTLWNQAAAQIFGLTKAQVLGKTDFDLFPEALAQEYREADLGAIAQPNQIQIPIEKTIGANGETRLLQTYKTRVLDAAGQPQYLLVITQDITEREQLKTSQRQQTARLRSFSEALGQLVRSKTREQMDLRGGLQEITEVACQTLNVAQAGVWIFNDDRSVLRLLDCCTQEDDTHSHSDGIELFATDYPLYFQAMESNRLISTPDARIDPRTCEFLDTYLNPYGITSMIDAPIWVRGEMIGVVCLEHAGPPRQWSVEEENFAGSLADFVSLVLESWNRKQAETALLQKTQHLETTLHELQQAQAHLIQSEKMSSLGQLVAGIAHEINNPVNFIYGNLAPAEEYIQDLMDLLRLYQKQYPNPGEAIAQQIETIELDFLLDDLPHLLDSMKVGAARIQEIVRSLRNFSRIDESAIKAIDIHEGLESTLLILRNRLKKGCAGREIQILKTYGDLPLVECYVGPLNQVFMNILSNAIDALEEYLEQPAIGSSDPSSAALPTGWIPQISLTTVALPHGQVAIHISDNGPGIDESVRQQLFDPFFTTKPSGKGTGLGMSISHQIVTEKHQGTLVCQSALGEGAEFIVQLPVKQVSF